MQAIDAPSSRRRALLTALSFPVVGLGPGMAQSNTIDQGEQAAWSALRSGGIALLRHADAPGYGDPPGFSLTDCSTQRNLGELGRAQAIRIGVRFRQEKVKAGKVLASQWCRTTETAQAAFPGQVEFAAVFNSFFQDRSKANPQTDMARALLLTWIGPSALVVVTHQVNITALSDIVPASGEGVVLRRIGQELSVVGRIRP